MNIGGTSLHAPAQMAMSSLKSALDMQESMAGQIMASGTGGGADMASAAAAEQGKGQNIDVTA